MSRYWSMRAEVEDPAAVAFGGNTAAIVDEQQGGIIAYCHEDNAAAIMAALQLADVGVSL